MKLEFVEWKIRLVSSNAMQYDNKAWKLELVGDLPEGWRWEVMLANGENMDIIPLDADGTGASALLTAENLSLWGDYAVQIRGKNGDVVRHSNKIHVYIPNSLSGDAKWPKLPTSFSRAEERITAAAENPPVPGDNGCWMIWDVSAGAYRQSDVPVTVAPVDRTADMTQPVGRDQDGRLWTAPGGGGGGADTVRYTAQELNDAQKEQARKNIGAGTSSFSGSYDDLTGKPTIPDGNLGITGASVGQIAKITAVDTDGKPTAWEPVDMPGGGGGGSSSMQETVLASGVVAKGTAKWHKENTGLTVADLQEWNLWGFVCLASAQTTTFGIYFGNHPTIKIGSTGCKAILSWFDDDHNAINVVDLMVQDGYIKIDKSFFLSGYSDRPSKAGVHGGYIPYVNNANDTVYIYTNDELTEDVAFKIVGLIK